ncbi:DUF7553 family protein [Halomicrobium salinisoli]|uniref:DUF7553 family protein n=1 Tax=Halomicrobium salinisoli TaxID=2878391 RepID=UPI001CEFEB19|nr:hypothetical protein [Halomicrobium salinisoli]
MTREELEAASDLLSSVADAAESADEERLETIADKLERFAEGDRGPDHGSLARIENALDDLEAEAVDDVAADVREAHEHVKEYRSGVEGV